MLANRVNLLFLCYPNFYGMLEQYMAHLENLSQDTAPLLEKTSDKSYGLENQIKDIDLSGLEEDLDEIYVTIKSKLLILDY